GERPEKHPKTPLNLLTAVPTHITLTPSTPSSAAPPSPPSEKGLECPRGGPAAPRHCSHSSSATGPSACWLCPAGWQPFTAKCYRISTKTESWEKAAKDCLDQRSQLVKLESDFLNQTLRKPTTYFWIGLSVPPAGQGWTWLNGSRLAPGWFRLSPKAEFGKCGALRRGRIVSESCSSELQWICQKPAPQL
uniref:C-type lectin domain-containing protein n=1 Tax=Bubo bubo TaxID=30461 RepID=A0A8C0FQZ5_BUBBB